MSDARPAEAEEEEDEEAEEGADPEPEEGPAAAAAAPAAAPGFLTTPAESGQSPPSTRNSDDLPAPLGPVTSRLVPAGTRRQRSRTRAAPEGVTTSQWSNSMPPSQASILPAPAPGEAAGPAGEESEEEGAAPFPSVSRSGAGQAPAILPAPLFLEAPLLPETSSAARCSAATLSACAPSFAAFLGPWARLPRAVKSEMMTFVW